MNNKNKLSLYIDTVWLAIGEAIAAALISVVFLLIGKFNYSVVTGAVLGGAVTVINFFILSVGINRAINKFVEERGKDEMDEEEADKYAKEHGMTVQNAMMKSYMLRMFLMIGALVLAGVSGWFDIIATVIPLLMYRPILYVTEFIKTKMSVKRGE